MTKTPINNLSLQARLVILELIRGFCLKLDLYKDASKKGMNPEMVEETVIELIDQGKIEICYDQDKKAFYLKTLL